MRYLPTPFHTKFAQQRTALSQYLQQEAVGTRMRRWERPLHDFLLPYLRGAVSRLTGEDIVPEEVQHRRDLDTLADMLQFLRARTEDGGAGAAAGPIIGGTTHRTRSPPCRAHVFSARAGGEPGRQLRPGCAAGSRGRPPRFPARQAVIRGPWSMASYPWVARGP